MDYRELLEKNNIKTDLSDADLEKICDVIVDKCIDLCELQCFNSGDEWDGAILYAVRSISDAFSKKKKVRIKDMETFGGVFGADVFIENFPDIKDKGIFVIRKFKSGNPNPLYYVTHDNGDIINDSAFFTENEFKEYLEVIVD